MNQSTPHVIVGMSGGVDSSVAALLLKQQGYHVEGLFMKNWEEDDGTEYCTAIEDLADAQQVCDHLGIRLHQANFAAEYWDNVFEHFLSEYRAGRTPNPDILCNREIKFKAFLDYALTLGADYIATGHYARLTSINGHTCLLKGIDDDKDQSYFLHAVGEQQFARTLFPLGNLKKTQVRNLAAKASLKVSDKKDSTGICFIGERRFRDFLNQYVPAQPGDILSTEGHKIGRHMGLMFYTIGQRQGLGIGGIQNSSGEAWYVTNKCLDNNQLIVGQGKHHPRLFSQQLAAGSCHWINQFPPSTSFKCRAKTRYRQPDQDCLVDIQPDDSVLVRFTLPQRAITPGQSIVFYEGEVCLGGAIIEKTVTENPH